MMAGELRQGLEVELDGDVIVRVGPQTGIPEPFVLSPAFVNAHSHLEYRSLMGEVDPALGYWDWIKALVARKLTQTADEVVDSCMLAARENRLAGVAYIHEHSDRPGSVAAMREAGLQGIVFQEILTMGVGDSVVAPARARAAELDTPELRVFPNPHAVHTVFPDLLREFARAPHPLTIHVAETEYESQLFGAAEGPLQDFYDLVGLPSRASGKTVIGEFESLGLARPGVQIVHACDISVAEIQRLVPTGVSVAHNPRSNLHLKCPPMRLREMLDAGMPVGLGLDSAASTGPIDMFLEMQEALATSHRRGHHVSAQEVWNVATELGASSVGLQDWRIEPGLRVPLIAIHSQAETADDLIAQGTPEQVEWIVNPR